eukprot:937073-Prorocentrum_minimum.AAC.1
MPLVFFTLSGSEAYGHTYSAAIGNHEHAAQLKKQFRKHDPNAHIYDSDSSKYSWTDDDEVRPPAPPASLPLCKLGGTDPGITPTLP